VYAEWIPQHGATFYKIAYNNIVTGALYGTSHSITGLQSAQHYNITVTAFRAGNSIIDSVTCPGDTGENSNRY